MSIVQPSIHSWSDGYRVLRKQAETHRGVILLNRDFADTASWPRTTGLDALAISAVFDGAVRAHLSPAAGQRWFQAWLVETDLLAREPQDTLTDTYAGNRSFWSTLAGVATLLDHLQAALPAPEAWDAALRQLATERGARRNDAPSAEDVTAEFPRVGSWDEMADLQLRFFRALRGEEFADGPLLVRIPHTTNADILQLATYWTEQLARSARHAAARYRHVYTHWGAALVDVSRHAQGAPPHVAFPCNREFWHALYVLATQAEASVEPPSPWTIHVQALSDHVEPRRNAGPIEHAIEHVIAKLPAVVSKVADASRKTLIEGLAKPLLYVGGGILALSLLLRGRCGDGSSRSGS